MLYEISYTKEDMNMSSTPMV